jgi:glycosyltransferase involved in cell wall biosynthesis
MKIAIVSKSNRFGGGASKVAEDLTTLLNENGHFAHHYRRDLANGYTKNSTSVYGKWEKIAKKVYYKLKYLGFQEIIPFELFHLLDEIKKHNYDLIHFHDLSSAISPFTLMYLSNKLPVIWTMHDCSVFTGGCIYPMNCTKYKINCKNCFQKSSWPMGGKFDLAFLYLRIKSKLHKKNIHLVSPSKWLANLSTHNTIIKKIPTIIPNGVDINIYKFLDKKISKENLNIPEKRLTILLTAHSIQDPRKGFDYAIKVINEINHLNPFLILVGNIDNMTKDLLTKIDYFSSGYIDNYTELNKLYSAADIFINCSLSDNLPLVVLETMASGTPTFGFTTGGIPEMIQQNINGYLVENKDTKFLAQKIEEIYLNKQLTIFSKNAREMAKNKFTHTIFLENHLEFYSSILTNN